MSKMTFKFKRVNVPSMTVEAWKEKLHLHVSAVERHSSTGILRITFKDLEPKGFIVDGRFIHYCEQNAGGNSCVHIALALAIDSMLGSTVDKVGFPKDAADFDTLNKMDDKGFVNINELVGLLQPVVEDEETAPSAPAAAPAIAPVDEEEEATAPAAGLRNWKKGWNEVQAHLEDQGLSTRTILQIQQLRRQICDSVQMTTMAVPPAKPKTPYMGEYLARVLRHILLGKDILLVGDKGTGKDTMVSTVAWVLGLPVYLSTGNGDETKESIVGENTIMQGEKGMEVMFKKSPFATAVTEGGLTHYAELNMLSGDVTSIFHSVLDENRSLTTPEGSIIRHNHHFFIGSINVGSQYAGVKRLNGAFKDRMSIVKLPYVQDFRGMLTAKTGLSDAYALDFLESIKKAVDELIQAEGQGQESKTVRGYIDAASYMQQYGFTFETKVEVVEDYVINRTEDVEEQMALRDIVRQKAFPEFPVSAEEELYINGGI